MGDLVDELLIGKKKTPLQETEINVKQIIEKTEEEEKEEEEQEEGSDVVLSVDIYINDDESTIEITSKQYQRKTITDFLSLLSLFKNSERVDVNQLLNSINSPAPPPEAAQDAAEEPMAGEEPASAQPTEENTFKLTSFGITAEEKVSESSENSVSITGEENINNALSFKVIVGETSTPFNTPDTAIQHFNNAFFNNIVQIIDKELQQRNE